MPAAFESERELHDFVKTQIGETLGEDTVIASECVSSLGVADLILGKLDEKKLAQRQAGRLGAILSYGLCAIIAALRHSEAPLTLSQVSEATGYSARYVSRRLMPELLRGGHVVCESRMYRLSTHYCNPVVEITALELKLHDWKRARAQARHYQAFADRSYIVMGLAGEVTNRIASSLSCSSIGLMLATPSGVTVKKDALYSEPLLEVDRLFVCEQVIRSLL